MIRKSAPRGHAALTAPQPAAPHPIISLRRAADHAAVAHAPRIRARALGPEGSRSSSGRSGPRAHPGSCMRLHGRTRSQPRSPQPTLDPSPRRAAAPRCGRAGPARPSTSALKPPPHRDGACASTAAQPSEAPEAELTCGSCVADVFTRQSRICRVVCARRYTVSASRVVQCMVLVRLRRCQ